MKREKVEVFLGNHVVNNKTDVKIELLGKTDKNPFIDPEGWQDYLRERYERAKYVIENE